MDLYHHRWFRPCNLDLQTFLALSQDSLLLFSQIVASRKLISTSPLVASSRKEEEPVRLIDDAAIRLRFGSETFELRRCDMTQGVKICWAECGMSASPRCQTPRLPLHCWSVRC